MGTRILAGTLAILLVAAVGAGCKSKKKGRMAPEGEGLDGGVLVYSDDFQRDGLGSDWLARSGKWEVREGMLHNPGDRNEGCWLNTPLHERVRVEFDAMSRSDDGDIKFEIFATEQRHQTGYIVIYGGWKNTISIIARLNEHGEDRLETDAHPTKGQTYRFAAVRTDGALSWYVDGRLVLRYSDESPIRGSYFAFNNWAADLWFDNLRIYRL